MSSKSLLKAMNTNLNDAKAVDDLLPCPFCGGPAIVIESNAGFTVHCQDATYATCDIGIIHRDWTRSKAVAIWNTRAPQPKAMERLEAIQDLQGRLEHWNEPKPKAMGETPRCDALNLQLHKDNADTGQCGMAFEELAKTFELELSEARAELATVKEQRDQSHQSNIKLKAGWQRLGDQCKGGNGPREFIRFSDACTKNKGDVVETMLSYLFSIWGDLGKSEASLTAANQRIESLEKQSLEALDYWKTYYEEEIDECELKAAACKGEGDMLGWNLYQGKLSGLVNHDIALTKFKNIYAAIAKTKTP